VTILAVTGLKREARIAGGPGVIAVIGGGDAKALSERLDALEGDITGVISFGIAGALSPLLKPGDVVIAERIVTARHSLRAEAPRKEDFAFDLKPKKATSLDEQWRCDNAWRVALAAAIPNAHQGTLAGSDTILEDTDAKSTLFANSGGALAVDMESHIAARFAAWRRVPLAGLRVISDAAHHNLPRAALVAMNPDGSIAKGRVFVALLRRPWQLPALIRTGRGSGKAFRELLRCRNLCGIGLGGVGAAGPNR
jgi:nucleoside phosphorylase